MSTRLTISAFFFAIINQVADPTCSGAYANIPDTISAEVQAFCAWAASVFVF